MENLGAVIITSLAIIGLFTTIIVDKICEYKEGKRI